MKIVITGGHITPAQALISSFSPGQYQVHLITTGFAGSGSQIPSIDRQIARRHRLHTHLVPACKWNRFRPLTLPLALFPCFTAFFSSLAILSRLKPDIVLGFGGYISLPIAYAAWILRIPVIIHEQTTQAGLANRLISPIAAKIAISHPASRSFFPASKTVLTGNFIRPEFTQEQPPPSWLKNPDRLPLIYITGGNQGAQAINAAVFPILDQLTPKYVVIHQFGRLPGSLRQARRHASRLVHPDRYFPVSYLEAAAVAWCMRQARLVIGRSGANTVHELFHTRSVSLLIPLPVSSRQEQLHNARLLADRHAALILPQAQLTPQSLLHHIDRIMVSYPDFHQAAASLSLPVSDSITAFHTLINQVAPHR